MPLQRCKLGSKTGWRYGASGKCYLLKIDAIKQGLAENNGKWSNAETDKTLAGLDDSEANQLLDDIIESFEREEEDFGNKFVDGAFAYLSKKQREKIPDEDFAGPNRSFPCHDKRHYLAALKLVGRKPKSEQGKIRKKILEIGKRKGWNKD